MEHYKCKKNTNIITAEFDTVNIKYLMRYRGIPDCCIYIYKNNILSGIIGKRELERSIKEQKIVVNSDFKRCLSENEDDIRNIIENSEQTFRVLPIMKDKNTVDFEVIVDRDAYYHELDIEYGLNTYKRKERIIVSLTSHGRRLDYVYIAIKSIMAQTMKADEIVLYLDESSDGHNVAHEDELVKAGLRIVRGKENLKPHCKYFYAMQEYENDLIITIDDDVIYPDNLIEDLYNAHMLYSDTVIAHRAHRAFDKDGMQLNPRNYEWEVVSKEPERILCATGVGGVLYPVGEYRKQFLQADVIKKCSINADDIWLMYIEAMIGMQVYALKSINLRCISNSQIEEGLSLKNDVLDENQIWIDNLEKFYGKTLKSLIYTTQDKH